MATLEQKLNLWFSVPVNFTSDICIEGTYGILKCINGKIKVLLAFYGRMSYITCKSSAMNTNRCFLDVSAKIVQM